MSQWKPEPPQGFSSEQELVIIGRPPIAKFSTPQGLGNGGISPVEVNQIFAQYPTQADPTFAFYKFYQVKPSTITETQFGMAVLIEDSLPIGVIQEALGLDIRAFDSDGLPIPYEYDDEITINPDTSADFAVWVLMPEVKDLDFIQLVFGKSGATDGQSTDTWDSHYRLVNHMSPDLSDSTANGNDVFDRFLTSTTNVAGKIGRARQSDGTGAMRALSDASLDIDGTSITMSAWVRSGTITNARVFGKDNNGVNRSWSLLIGNETTNVAQFILNLNVLGVVILTGTIPISDTVPTQLVGTYDGAMMRLYVNGVLDVAMAASGAIITNINNVDIFSGNIITEFNLTGDIDEIRVTDLPRSLDWVEREFANQNDQDAFWFRTPLLDTGETNFMVDDLGNTLVAVIP